MPVNRRRSATGSNTSTMRAGSLAASTPTATLAFFGFTFMTTLLVPGQRVRSRSTSGASSDTAGVEVTTVKSEMPTAE